MLRLSQPVAQNSGFWKPLDDLFVLPDLSFPANNAARH